MTRDLSRASGTLRPMPPSPKGPLRPIQILKGMQKLPKRRLKRIVNPRWHATEVGGKAQSDSFDLENYHEPPGGFLPKPQQIMDSHGFHPCRGKALSERA